METKEVTISVPKGFEVDVKNSTFEKIIFKKKETERWRDNKDAEFYGYYIGLDGDIYKSNGYNTPDSYGIFATNKLAKAAIAMARISQIIDNDSRFGGVITDKEWADHSLPKYTINSYRNPNKFEINVVCSMYNFLAFHTEEQVDLFLAENMDLLNDYFMVGD